MEKIRRTRKFVLYQSQKYWQITKEKHEARDNQKFKTHGPQAMWILSSVRLQTWEYHTEITVLFRHEFGRGKRDPDLCAGANGLKFCACENEATKVPNER